MVKDTMRTLTVIVLLILAATSAEAQTSLTLALPPTVNATPVFIAIEQGIFARHNLAVKPVFIALTGNIPPTILSGSADIGLMPTTVFLQAVDGGLDLVGVSGGSITSHHVADYSLLVRTDIAYTKPSDLVGLTMGIAGMTSPHIVVIRSWLTQHGIDPAGIHFVEISFQTMADTLRHRAVDAVIATDPAQSQITSANLGRAVVPVYAEIPEGLPWLLYAATRPWTATHAADLANLRAALTEAEAANQSDPERARQDFAKYVKLPSAVLQSIALPEQNPQITPQGLRWWIDTMNQQQMLTTTPNPASLIMN